MKNKILTYTKTKARKVIAVSLAILIITTVLIVGIVALGGASKSLTLKLTPSTNASYPTKEIELILSASDFNGLNGIYGFLLEMTFDNLAFKFKEAKLKQKNTPDSKLSLKHHLAENNRLLVLFHDESTSKPLGYLDEGDLISFKFEALATAAAGDYDFILSRTDFTDDSAKNLASVSFVGDSNKAKVKIQELSIENIEFKSGTSPAPQAFFEGDDFSVVGEITLKYTDGSQTDLSITKEMCSGYNMNPAFGPSDHSNLQTVSVTLGSQTLTYDITVNKKVVSEIIAIKTPPAKIKYLTGQSLDVSGMVVSVNYNSGTVSDVIVKSDMVTGFDNAVAGTQTLTVTLDTKSISFDVEVISRAVVDKLIQDIRELNVAGLTLSDKETISHLNEIFDNLSALEKAEVGDAEITKLKAATDKITELSTTTTSATATNSSSKADGTETGDKSLDLIVVLALPISILLLFVLVYKTKLMKLSKRTSLKE